MLNRFFEDTDHVSVQTSSLRGLKYKSGDVVLCTLKDRELRCEVVGVSLSIKMREREPHYEYLLRTIFDNAQDFFDRKIPRSLSASPDMCRKDYDYYDHYEVAFKDKRVCCDTYDEAIKLIGARLLRKKELQSTELSRTITDGCVEFGTYSYHNGDVYHTFAKVFYIKKQKKC